MKTLLCLIACLAFGFSAARAEEPKNVLFLIADDLNCYIGAYGHPLAKTPSLDRLAARGTQFTKAYCQYPVCNASRASIFSGLRPAQTGVRDNWVHFRHTTPNVKTLPQWFKEHGYTSARVGKIYHYNVPKEIGMDCMDDPASWSLRYNPIGRDKHEEEQITTLKAGQYGGTLSWMAQEGTDDDQTDGKGAIASMNLLERFQESGQPFFLAFGMFRPHTPFVAPREYFDLYPLEDIQVDENFREDWEDVPSAALLSLHREELELDTATKKEVIQAYLASISFMDAQVGRMLDKLEELGLSDSTAIVFTSDHGYHMHEHGLWQKMSLFENATRVPLIIATPDQKEKGAVCESVVELIDLYPTLVEWAGLSMPDEMERDGQSLLPMLNDPSLAGKSYAISEVVRSGWAGIYRMLDRGEGPGTHFYGYSIRTPRYRYNRWAEGEEGEELYDHQNDPGEMTNLAANPEMEPVKKELAGQLAPFEQAHGEPRPMGPNDFLKPVR